MQKMKIPRKSSSPSIWSACAKRRFGLTLRWCSEYKSRRFSERVDIYQVYRLSIAGV